MASMWNSEVGATLVPCSEMLCDSMFETCNMKMETCGLYLKYTLSYQGHYLSHMHK
jgi:hypothetical protein